MRALADTNPFDPDVVQEPHELCAACADAGARGSLLVRSLVSLPVELAT
jgi:hypothetical protein